MSDDPKKTPSAAPPDDDRIPQQVGNDGLERWHEQDGYDEAMLDTTTGNITAHITEEARADFMAEAEIIPGPATRFAELQARVDALETLLTASAAIGPGHNNPPEAIDAGPLLPTRTEASAVILVIRQLEPSPRAVPAEAKAAEGILEQMVEKFRAGFADEAGKMAARVAVPVMSVTAVGLLIALIEVAHALVLWIEAVVRSAL